MPVKVQCPLCGTQVTVSDTALGTTVGCPWCRHRFRAESAGDSRAGETPAADVPLATPPVKESPAEPGKPERVDPGIRAEAAAQKVSSAKSAEKKVTGEAVPPPSARAAEAKGSEAANRGVRPTGGVKGKGPSTSPPAPTDGLPVREAEGAERSPASLTSPTTSKERKVARLILTQTAEPTWKLAPDGSLPALHLVEDSGDRPRETIKRQSNPLLLVVVLAASLLTSLALLFVEPEPTARGDARLKEAARREIAAEYFSNPNPEAPLAEYQRLLREAHWAHSRGDFKREQQLYRRVLMLLYAESGRSYTGLTGSRSRDKRLEELLRILLKQ